MSTKKQAQNKTAVSLGSQLINATQHSLKTTRNKQEHMRIAAVQIATLPGLATSSGYQANDTTHTVYST